MASFSMNPNAAKEAALRAARAKASSASSTATAESGQITRWIPPAEARERLRILFDDSGSMSGHIEEAKEGVIELYRSSVPNQTAVAVHMIDSEHSDLEALNTNLIEAATILKGAKPGLGGTPLFSKFHEAAGLEPKATRFVMFTDGEPNREIPQEYVNGVWGGEEIYCQKDADKLIARAKELKTPVDTVFFGSASSDRAIKLLKYIADGTGGYFLHFDPKKVNFRQAFKYLAAGNRLMIASESVRREIESGQRS